MQSCCYHAPERIPLGQGEPGRVVRHPAQNLRSRRVGRRTEKARARLANQVNPHVLVYFEVSGKDGIVNWLGEGPPVINWTRLGWNRNSIKAGDQVTVTLYPARNGKPEGVLAKMVTANGKEWCCETK